MGDRLDEFVLGDAVLDGAAEVEAQLLGVALRGQDRDGDEAAVAGGQLGAVPDVVEEDVVGELGHLGGEVAERGRARRRPASSVPA